MGPRKKPRKATPPHHQQHVPSAATNSTLYTSSYMIVQELSPPFSSPQPSLQSPSSPENTHELPGATTPSGARPRTSQADRSSQKARTRQTTKPVNVPIRSKELLPDYVEPDRHTNDDNCKTIMRKLSAAVEDRGFQSRRQVKAWMMRQYHQQQRSAKAPATSSTIRTSRTSILRKKKNNGAVLFGAAFEKNLVPIISTLLMKINAQKFLRSVIEAIGTRRLTRVFRHRLVRDDELPDDISPLIFSPLFLKAFERQIQKVNLVTSNRVDSDDSESEWPDWEEEEDDDEASDENVAMWTIGSDALPSIEQENSSEDVPELVTGEKSDGPSTPVESQESEIRTTRAKMNRKARRKIDCDARKAGCKDDAHGCSQNRPTLPGTSTIEDPARRPVSDEVQVQVQVQIQDQVAERARSAGRESETLFPPAPTVRPFADFTTPIVSEPPDHETESILHFRSLLRNISEQNSPKRLKKVNTGRVVHETQQHVANSGPQGEDKTKRKTATEDPGKLLSTSNNQVATPSISQAKDGPTSISNPALPVRETPAILRAENQRQDRKLAKPLAPTNIPSRPAQRKQKCPLSTRWTQREISALQFYNLSSTGNAGVQPKYSEHTRDTKASKSHDEEKGNRPQGNKNVAQDIPSEHYRLSRQNSPSDDELSLPSLEDIYGSLLTAQGRSTETTQPATTTTKARAIQTGREPRPEPLTRRGNSSKKRPVGECTEENTTSSPPRASSPKRMKLPADARSGMRPGAGGSSQHNPSPRQPRAGGRTSPPLGST
ncbi:hypothetical protein F4782DRAFT_453995 [Xylaria castorea]|nr:hypothetical protein F4782DRAFT_453995 [Xylaria castorea]